MTRQKLKVEYETQVLTESRRRCAFCFCLNNDFRVKKGQIAHIDHNHSNPKTDNLVFLCLEHHDEYDTQTSQSKGFKPNEVKNYKHKLYEHIQSWTEKFGDDLKTKSSSNPNKFFVYELINKESVSGYKYLAINETREVYVSFNFDHISIDHFYWEVSKWLNCDYKKTEITFDFDLIGFNSFLDESFFTSDFSLIAFLDGDKTVFTLVISISDFGVYYEIEFDLHNGFKTITKRADGFERVIPLHDKSDSDYKTFFGLAQRLEKILEVKVSLNPPVEIEEHTSEFEDLPPEFGASTLDNEDLPF